LRIIVADAGTMSHGLDLTRATVICWYAPIDKAETYQQANARIHRPGQNYPTTIVQLASTTDVKGAKTIIFCLSSLTNSLSETPPLLRGLRKDFVDSIL
jgi:hypothetical protein